MCPLLGANSSSSSSSSSSRWCPTREQVMILEEMYKAGVRTPSASQIQKVTAHLSLYGKIEGKNVFYWFQNHKARDRQKLRRRNKLTKQHQDQLLINNFHHHFPLFLHSPPANSTTTTTNPSSSLAHYTNPPSVILPPLNYTHVIPPAADHQGEHVMMLHNWKSSDTIMDYNKELNHRTMKMYSGGWMMVEEEEQQMDSPSCRTNRPVETLQLFPTTCTNLKQDPARRT